MLPVILDNRILEKDDLCEYKSHIHMAEVFSPNKCSPTNKKKESNS